MNAYKFILTIGVLLIGISFAYWVIVRPILREQKLQKCLELAGRREIEGLPRYTLGLDVGEYFDNCYKRFR